MAPENLLLKGKNALVTGAGKGIGREIARALARNGANVCLVSRTGADLEIVSKELEAYGVKAIPISADVSKKGDADRIAREVQKKLASLDLLVCAAGFPLLPELWRKELHQLTEEDFLKVFDVDVMGSFRIIKVVLPVMMKQRGGVIIVFSSTPAIAGYNLGAPYTVAKAANLGLIKDLAAEYGKYNIRAYAIAPGNIKTERTYGPLSRKEKTKLAEEAPLQRWGEPAEVAEVVAVLASDRMSFVTGQTIVVDGGTIML